jgi:protein-disulfide isomerase
MNEITDNEMETKTGGQAGDPAVREHCPQIQVKPAEETARNPGMKTMEIFALTIILSTLVLAGTIVYTTNAINIRLDSINSDVGGLKASLAVAGNSSGSPPAQAQPSQPPPIQKGAEINLQGKVPRGDPSAPVTIVVYSDFQCPFCARLKPTMDKLLQEYPGKVKVYYKQFPLTQIHQYAQKAAEASECAADQGKFWEYHDKLFENQGALDIGSLKKYAVDLGLDANAFNSCLDSGAKEKQVSSELQEGLSNGVQGTPASFVNGQLIGGAQPYSNFQQVMESELARLSG